jgi:integrator complex subunit 2
MLVNILIYCSWCGSGLKVNCISFAADTEELPADVSSPSLTSQLLLLYYLLLYEDVRLANTHSYVQAGRKVKSYSTEFLSELPIKYLLQQAQKDQQSYAGLWTLMYGSCIYWGCK